MPSSEPAGEPILEVLPLNSEQRSAVRQGLNNQLSVITGPPGTGKSQVVTSLLINATHKGQKVLFSSKNHKAVDVVQERVNGLGNRPVLLRLGPKEEFRVALSDYLTQLLASKTQQEDHDAPE